MDQIRIEVAYALPETRELIVLSVPAGTTVMEAIELSGLREKYPDIEPGGCNKIGIFGKLCKLEQQLQAGDRVEIYRPLKADPKEVRRRLAAEGKSMGKASGQSGDKPGN